jgi:uncharacterized protein (TIGR02246 family)
MKMLRRGLVLVACIWCSLALAGPKEDAYQAVEMWAAAFNAGDLDKIVAVYAPNALVFGTLSPKLASNADDLRAYFKRSVAAKSHVTLGDNSAIVLSPEAVTFAGFYGFTRPGKDGAPPKTNQARYSVVVVKQGGALKIVHHHSSPRPKPAQQAVAH